MQDVFFAVAVALSTQGNTQAEPATAQPEPTATEKLLAEPTPDATYALNGPLIPSINPLDGFRMPGRGMLPTGDGGSLFATPLPSRGFVPEGARLAAPVITPTLKHGHLGYDVLPVGRVDSCDPIWTRHPEDFVSRPRYEALSWRVWGSAEVLLGTTSGVSVPPLVTTEPLTAGVGTAGCSGGAFNGAIVRWPEDA